MKECTFSCGYYSFGKRNCKQLPQNSRNNVMLKCIGNSVDSSKNEALVLYRLYTVHHCSLLMRRQHWKYIGFRCCNIWIVCMFFLTLCCFEPLSVAMWISSWLKIGLLDMSYTKKSITFKTLLIKMIAVI